MEYFILFILLIGVKKTVDCYASFQVEYGVLLCKIREKIYLANPIDTFFFYDKHPLVVLLKVRFVLV